MPLDLKWGYILINPPKFHKWNAFNTPSVVDINVPHPIPSTRVAEQFTHDGWLAVGSAPCLFGLCHSTRTQLLLPSHRKNPQCKICSAVSIEKVWLLYHCQKSPVLLGAVVHVLAPRRLSQEFEDIVGYIVNLRSTKLHTKL